MVLQITALFLAWWVVTNRTDSSSPSVGIGLFGGGADWANSQVLLLTAVLAIAPIPLIFVRVAAASWRHEPTSWRRDLWIAGALQFLALGSALAWPIEGPFWGGRTYILNNATGETLTITANPGLGWWVAAVALLCTAWGIWLSRPAAATDK